MDVDGDHNFPKCDAIAGTLLAVLAAGSTDCSLFCQLLSTEPPQFTSTEIDFDALFDFADALRHCAHGAEGAPASRLEQGHHDEPDER